MDGFHLLRPWWLLVLAPLAVVLWLLWERRGTPLAWRSVCDPRLLPWLLESRLGPASRSAVWIAGAAGLLAILALAGPAWQKIEQPVFRQESALVVALDLSTSMGSSDLTPSRLLRARHKLLDILAQRQEGQTALIVYAAQSFVVTPLTDDSDTIAALVNSLDTTLMPSQGSRADRALEQANELLEQAGIGRGEVLLITDSVGGGEPDLVVDRLRASGHRLHVLGIGTSEGAPIPLPEGDFFKNDRGAIVVPGLEEDGLRRLAERGAGRYSRYSLDDQDIDYLLRDEPPGTVLADESEFAADLWREEGPWLLLPLLPLAAFAFRRGYLVLLLGLLHLPQPVQAIGWETLWQRPDQRAAALLQQGEAAQAADLFQDPLWQGAALYRAGEFRRAAEALQGIDTPDAQYNRGNALARAGRLKEALGAYDQALTAQPGHADARYNRDLVAEALKQKEQQGSADSGESEASEPAGNDGQGETSTGDPGAQPQAPPGEQPEESRQPSDGESQGQPADRTEQEPPGSEAADQGDEPSPGEEARSDKEQAPGDPPPSDTESTEPMPAGKSDAATEQPRPAEQQPLSEQEQATQQWLRRIPDDPGGLLRRKFQYQYQRLPNPNPETKNW